MGLDAPWGRVLELAWEGFCAGTAPIGAVVVDPRGEVASEARSRRFDETAPAGELAGSRIAHAELNALAKLPVSGYYTNYALYTSVEPCCLCMGAAIQTGVGQVVFAWRDPYAGATPMLVQNPQVALKNVRIGGPEGGEAARIAALLLAAHYVLDVPDKPHVTAPMREQDPHIFRLVEEEGVGELLASARARGVSLAEACDELGRVW